MRKNALTICCFTCAAGAIGAFCRWLQNQLAFDESGLSAQSVWNYIVPLVILAAAVCFYSFVLKYKRSGLVMTTDFYDTFSSSTLLFVPAAWIIGALMIFGSMILIATCADNSSVILYRILAGLGVLSGISFGLTAVGARRKYESGLICVFVTVPVIQFCLWLITSYKQIPRTPPFGSMPWKFWLLPLRCWHFIISLATPTVGQSPTAACILPCWVLSLVLSP